MNISEALSRVHNGRRDVVVTPKRRISRPPVVVCHGLGGDATQAAGYANPGMHEIIAKLVNKLGLPVVATSHTDGFGNALSQTEGVADALVYARANLGASNDKAVLIGASAGASVVLDFAANNPNLVACVIGLIPVLDQQAIRVANTVVGGQNLRNAIDAAHGVVYPAALPAGVNPATRAVALSAVPIQLWYSSNDAVSVNIDAFATATGAEKHSVGALGHTPAAIVAVDDDAVAEFVRLHL